MPIRFRCVYCNQLLGISRRKAGTIVRCTTCEGQLIVPDASAAAPPEAGSHEHAAKPLVSQPQQTEDAGGPVGVFDADDFGAFIAPFKSAGGGGPAVVSPPAPSVRRAPAGAPAPTVHEMRVGAGPSVTLTRRGLTIAIVLAVMGLGLSFAAGLWVGMR